MRAVAIKPTPSVMLIQSAKLSPTVVHRILMTQNHRVTSGTLLSISRAETGAVPARCIMSAGSRCSPARNLTGCAGGQRRSGPRQCHREDGPARPVLSADRAAQRLRDAASDAESQSGSAVAGSLSRARTGGPIRVDAWAVVD